MTFSSAGHQRDWTYLSCFSRKLRDVRKSPPPSPSPPPTHTPNTTRGHITPNCSLLVTVRNTSPVDTTWCIIYARFVRGLLDATVFAVILAICNTWSMFVTRITPATKQYGCLGLSVGTTEREKRQTLRHTTLTLTPTLTLTLTSA